MSGALKEVRNRIKSVQSTQQITKAMKMVSAAKLRRAQDAITQMRPYAKKLQEVLGNIVSNSDGDINLALATERAVEKVLVIIVTSDRGLCRSGVIKSFRGKGIQKKLIRSRERFSRTLGWKWLITDTTDNPPSSNSLISCG